MPFAKPLRLFFFNIKGTVIKIARFQIIDQKMKQIDMDDFEIRFFWPGYP